MSSSEARPSFTCFNKLPTEVRLIIWKWASLHPRIVHLSKERLATDDDPNWWRSVRSDKAIEALEDDVESDYGSIDEDGIDLENMDLQMAMERLLTPDDKYKGNISRADAKAILRSPRWPYPRPSIAGYDYPKNLYGFRSESPVPGVLLACRESFGVGCRIYSRAFGALGARPSVWFNFSRDTLYLDHFERGNQPAAHGLLSLCWVLEQLFARDELARIEKLALHRGPSLTNYWIDDGITDGGHIDEGRDDYQLFYSIRRSHKLFPNVEQLTIVDGHYAHQDRTMTKWDRSGDQFVDLKFMKSTFDSEFCWRVNGFRIDTSLLHGGIHPQRSLFTELDEIHWDLDVTGDQAPWRFPKTNIEVIVSTADEERLLHDAYLFEKEHNKGCWYINPSDPTDCDYYAGDEIDGEIESLL